MIKVKVSICGKDYTLSSEETAEVVRDRAERAQRMITHFTDTSRLNVQNAAVLSVLDALTDADKYSKIVDGLRTQITEYVDEAVKARATADEAARKLEKYKTKHDDAVMRTAELEREAKKKTDVSGELAAIKKELDELKADVANKERYAYERGKLESAETARAAVETSRETADKSRLRADELSAKVDELTTKADELTEKNVKLGELVTDLEKQVADLKKSAAETGGTAAGVAVAATSTSMAGQIHPKPESEKLLKARNTELRRTLDNIRKENQTLKRENDLYSLKFQEKDIELDEMKARFAELESVNLKQTADIAELWEKLESKV